VSRAARRYNPVSRPQSIVVMQRFCKPQSLVRFRVGAPALLLALLSLVPAAPASLALAAAGRQATAPVGCGRLCGNWALDAAASDAAAPAVEAAISAWRDDPPRRRRRAPADGDPLEAMMYDLDEPEDLQKRRTMFGEELRSRTIPPAALQVGSDRADVVLTDARGTRRFRPGEPHSWIDANGTASIETRWVQGNLVIEERYDRRRWTRSEYVVSPDGLQLTLSLKLRRPGIPELSLRSVYRRAAGGSITTAPVS
jgi:hypothetical protein